MGVVGRGRGIGGGGRYLPRRGRRRRGGVEEEAAGARGGGGRTRLAGIELEAGWPAQRCAQGRWERGGGLGTGGRRRGAVGGGGTRARGRGVAGSGGGGRCVRAGERPAAGEREDVRGQWKVETV